MKVIDVTNKEKTRAIILLIVLIIIGGLVMYSK
jgi:hypothetical protein